MNNFNGVFEILFGILFLSLFIFALKTRRIYGGGKNNEAGYVRKDDDPKKYWLITIGWFVMALFEFGKAFFSFFK
jgi:hypothetical protein